VRRIQTLRKQVLDPAEVNFFSDLQKMLAKRNEALPSSVSTICGVDAAYHGDRVFAAACMFQMGRLAAKGAYSGMCSLPYVAGLFYLREGPFVVAAVRSLKVRPQLLCFDAHGAAHPRSAGLATTCGMLLGIPSIGIAKSMLVGEVSYSTTTGLGRIVYGSKTVGFVTTTTGGSKRYWSPGYSVTLASLRSIIRMQASECLQAMSEADRSARQSRLSFARDQDEFGSAARSG
jgi:deoxyribonuclease V